MTADKGDFVRIVRTTEGTVEVDPSGKANGRGAYLHKSGSCWEEALEKEKLGRALRTTISTAARAELTSAWEQLVGDED